jgi:hypothetical protein
VRVRPETLLNASVFPSLYLQVHDRAQVFVTTGSKRMFVGTVSRWAPRLLQLSAEACFPGATLEILVRSFAWRRCRPANPVNPAC